MHRKLSNRIIMVLAVLSVLAIGATAIADQGYGRSGRGMGYQGKWACDGQGQGYGRGHRYGYGSNDISEEDMKELDQERSAFFEATKDLRREIYQKRLEMKAEFAKKETQAKTVTAMQREISKLQSQFNQKRIEHQLKMKEINPDLVGRGPGISGKGPGGRGGFSGRPCRQ